MRRVLVRYKVKPECLEENEKLVKAVYAELNEKKPAAFRYASLKSSDGWFFHLASIEGGSNPLAESDAFKAFQAGLRDRCEEPPNPVDLELVGAFGFFE